MIVLEGDKLTDKIPNAIVTSGTFDGVHIGHQKILNGISEQAKKYGGKSVVLTFWPHPRFIINPNEKGLKLLSTFEEKSKLIEESNIDYLIKLAFTKEFSKLSSEQFIRQILIDKIGTQKLVIGYDHHFGKNREGSFDYLKSNTEKFGFEVQEIPRQDVDHIGVSSTKIRNALIEGQVEVANEYLGRPYELTGVVVHGDHLGAQIGFPTANIEVAEEYKLIPGNGVYAVKVMVADQMYDGMMNIGFRPTVDGNSQKMEVNIFDFSGDLYNKYISVSFINWIREEKKFENISELKNQLIHDKITTKTLLGV
ncbi:bifunctional riboflavin kinase/FAD synthetase [Reichenbachiella sp. MALMAid0571]|uniref:bifunctional riboflavin kinase/FAD synthetase n=1 Tax=Reichenbachiella sp. MALMAid0571 TaxID=3143939 RepID=UPI0032DFCAE6